MTGHTGAVRAVAFSGNGNLGISGSLDTTVRVWNLKTGKQVQLLKGHPTQVLAVALDHTGQYALSSDLSGTVVLWDVKAGKAVYRLMANEDGGYVFWATDAKGNVVLNGADAGLNANVHLVQGNNTYPLAPLLRRFKQPTLFGGYTPGKHPAIKAQTPRPSFASCKAACSHIMALAKQELESKRNAKGEIIKPPREAYAQLEEKRRRCPNECVFRGKISQVKCMQQSRTYKEARNCVGPVNRAVAMAQKWADAVCKCKTIACAKQTTASFRTKIRAEFGKKPPTGHVLRQMREAGVRGSQCIKKLK